MTWNKSHSTKIAPELVAITFAWQGSAYTVIRSFFLISSQEETTHLSTWMANKDRNSIPLKYNKQKARFPRIWKESHFFRFIQNGLVTFFVTSYYCLGRLTCEEKVESTRWTFFERSSSLRQGCITNSIVKYKHLQLCITLHVIKLVWLVRLVEIELLRLKAA